MRKKAGIHLMPGFLIRPLRKFFPAIVTGTVIMAIGLSLIPVGINFFGGSGIVPAGLIAIVLNILIPKDKGAESVPAYRK